MNISVRELKIEDAADLTVAINNKKVLDNLRDGIPFPHTVKDAEQYLKSITVVLLMAVIKQKETSPSSSEDTRYRQVMSEIDDIFKQGRKEAAQSDGISLQDCIKGIKALVCNRA